MELSGVLTMLPDYYIATLGVAGGSAQIPDGMTSIMIYTFSLLHCYPWGSWRLCPIYDVNSSGIKNYA